MKTRRRFRIPAIILLVAGASASAQNPKAPFSIALTQQMIANEQGLIAAKKRGDSAMLKSLITDDFAMVGVDGQLQQGQDALDNLGDSDLVELRPYDIMVIPVAADTAIVSYDAIVREAPQEDQGPPPRYQHFSSVWVKQSETWKLSFQQSTPTKWGDW